MSRTLLFTLVFALSLHAAVAGQARTTPATESTVRAEALWYLRSPSGALLPAWFEPGARGLELRVMDRDTLHTSEVQFDDAGFVQLQPGLPLRRWRLDGVTWRELDGSQLIPAWVIPAGRGPGH